jgi:hypothetical protein
MYAYVSKVLFQVSWQTFCMRFPSSLCPAHVILITLITFGEGGKVWTSSSLYMISILLLKVQVPSSLHDPVPVLK